MARRPTASHCDQSLCEASVHLGCLSEAVCNSQVKAASADPTGCKLDAHDFHAPGLPRCKQGSRPHLPGFALQLPVRQGSAECAGQEQHKRQRGEATSLLLLLLAATR